MPCTAKPPLPAGGLCIAISQSGETLDTLAAMREAKSRGATTMTLCNVVGSAMTRLTERTPGIFRITGLMRW